MKIYKAIFRIDYPISFKIIDSLGSYLDFLSQKLKSKPFSNFQSNIDFLNHSLEAKSKLEEDGICRFVLSPKAIDVLIEFKKGLDIEKLIKNPVSEVYDETIKRVNLEGFSTFDRIGVRLWIVDDSEENKFNELLNYLLKLNNPVNDIFKKNDFPPYDMGIVIDSKNEQGVNIHMQYGPYQKTEELRYFSLKPEIKEGLIMDIDISQDKISIPQFSFLNLIKRYQGYFSKISSDIVDIHKKRA